jgi:hypothetical protein
MNRLSLSVGVALAAMLALSTPSYARDLVSDPLAHTALMNQGDEPTGHMDVVAASPPAGGQNAIDVIENIHYKNVPPTCWSWGCQVHNTDYFIARKTSARWVAGLNRWILHDSDGNWYAFDTGNTSASILSGKPAYDVGARNAVMGAGDSRRLASVGDGGMGNNGRVLAATYGYTHSEELAYVTYTMTEPVATTYVTEQSASFAYVSGQLWSVDTTGHVAYHNEKPWSDIGLRNSLLSSNDRAAGSYPGVTAGAILGNGNTRELIVTWTYVHEEDFQRVRYSIQTPVQAELVQLDSGSAYMAWINGTEYAVRTGSGGVERLARKPVVELGGRSYSLSGDSPAAVNVFDVVGSNPVLVTLRYNFLHDTQYVVQEYHVDRQATASYSQNLNLWLVNINGNQYAVAFDGDDTSSYSGSVVHAPSTFSRPALLVPGTGGAVVPGVPSAPASGNSCIRGVNCPPAPATTPNGNSCIRGVNCPPAPATTPQGNSCIKGVTC